MIRAIIQQRDAPEVMFWDHQDLGELDERNALDFDVVALVRLDGRWTAEYSSGSTFAGTNVVMAGLRFDCPDGIVFYAQPEQVLAGDTPPGLSVVRWDA